MTTRHTIAITAHHFEHTSAATDDQGRAAVATEAIMFDHQLPDLLRQVCAALSESRRAAMQRELFPEIPA